MICDKCKRFFVYGKHPISGVPNGVKMILKGNKSITLCAECVCSIATMDENQKDAFFNELKGEKQ